MTSAIRRQLGLRDPSRSGLNLPLLQRIALYAVPSLLLGTLVPSWTAQAAPAGDSIQFLRENGSFAHFSTPNPAPSTPPLEVKVPLPAGISELTLIGGLQLESQHPTFFFSVKNCAATPCQKNLLSIHPVPKAPGSLPVQIYVFPGRILDARTGELVLESRAFLGKCHPNYGEAYWVFQREKIDRKRGLVSSVFVAEARESETSTSFLAEKLIEKRRAPRVKALAPFIKQKKCIEITGIHRTQLRRPLDLRPRHSLDEDDSDEERTPESQDAEKEPSVAE
jgi:hypothetical protein